MVSSGTLTHIYENYNISPICVKQFLHFASQLTDQQLEEMTVESEKQYLENAEEYQAKGIVKTLLSFKIKNEFSFQIQALPCDNLEVTEMLKQQETIMKGQVPDLLVSTQAVLHHCSGKRDNKDPSKNFVMIKLLHANGKDITEIPMKAETDLDECNARFVYQMREFQKINNMNDRLIEVLKTDPAAAATPLFQVAREQSASVKFLIRQTGMVHLTIVASVAKRLGMSSMQQDVPESNQIPNGIIAFDGVQIKQEPEDPPGDDDDDDDDCIIEVVDEDQKQHIAMLTAAASGQDIGIGGQFQKVTQNLEPAIVNQQSIVNHGDSIVNNASIPIANNAPVQIVQNGGPMQHEVVAMPVQLKLEDLRLEPQTSGDTDKPYWLVINGDIGGRPSFMTTAGMTSRTHRTRNITSETYVTVPRQQPMFAVQDGTLSMYAKWNVPVHNDAETKMNLSFMGMVSLRRRTGQQKFFKYTTANKDQGHYRMTHSSFWDISTKIRDRQASMSEEKTPEESVDYDAQFIERLVGGTYTNTDLQGPSNAPVTIPVLVAPEDSTSAEPSTSGQSLLMRSPRPQSPPLRDIKMDLSDE